MRAAIISFVVFGCMTRPLWAQHNGEAAVALVGSHATGGTRRGELGGFVAGLGIGSGPLSFGPEFMLQNGGNLRIRTFTVGLRLRQKGRRVSPHLAAGLGAFAWQYRTVIHSPDLGIDRENWSEIHSLGGSLGAGLALGRLDAPVTFVIDGRWHQDLTNDGDGSRTLLALSAGLRFAW